MRQWILEVRVAASSRVISVPGRLASQNWTAFALTLHYPPSLLLCFHSHFFQIILRHQSTNQKNTKEFLPYQISISFWHCKFELQDLFPDILRVGFFEVPYRWHTPHVCRKESLRKIRFMSHYVRRDNVLTRPGTRWAALSVWYGQH